MKQEEYKKMVALLKKTGLPAMDSDYIATIFEKEIDQKLKNPNDKDYVVQVIGLGGTYKAEFSVDGSIKSIYLV